MSITEESLELDLDEEEEDKRSRKERKPKSSSGKNLVKLTSVATLHHLGQQISVTIMLAIFLLFIYDPYFIIPIRNKQ